MLENKCIFNMLGYKAIFQPTNLKAFTTFKSFTSLKVECLCMHNIMHITYQSIQKTSWIHWNVENCISFLPYIRTINLCFKFHFDNLSLMFVCWFGLKDYKLSVIWWNILFIVEVTILYSAYLLPIVEGIFLIRYIFIGQWLW